MEEKDIKFKCPKCESINTIVKLERTKFTDIGWEDGLGSPGTISLRIRTLLCKDCLHVWESIRSK